MKEAAGKMQWNLSGDIWRRFPVIPGDFPGKFDGVYFWSEETCITEKTSSNYIRENCGKFDDLEHGKLQPFPAKNSLTVPTVNEFFDDLKNVKNP